MWIKNLRQRKLQTLLIFLIITICTMLLAGAASILTSLEKPSKEFASNCNAATAKLYPYTYDTEKIQEIGLQFEELSCVESVEYLKYHYLDENLLLNGNKVDAFANLTVYKEAVFGSVLYLEGDTSRGASLTSKECILPVSLSNEYDVHIGDSVTVQLTGRDVTYEVVGVYTDPYQTSTAYDSDILIYELPEDMNEININIYGKDGVTGRQIEEAYHEKYEGILNGFILPLEDRIENGLIVGRIIGAMFLSIGIIMLLVSGLMIYYMIKNALLADEKTIAVYRTLGYTSGDIMKMYLTLYFIIITVACLIGILFSVFISDTILSSVFENMGQLQADNSILSGVICYLVITVFILLLITSLLRSTRRTKPVTALSGIDYGGIKKKKNYKGNSTFQFSAFGIAYRTFLREKRSALSIIITCIITIFSVNFIVISLDVANNMKEDNDYWIGVDQSDVMINVVDPADYDDIKSMLEQDSRTDYYIGSNYDPRIALEWKKGMTNTTMVAFVYDDFVEADLPVTDGRNPDAPDEIALSTKMAEEYQKSIGDYIEVYLNDSTKTNLLITGLFQSYMQFGRLCRLTSSIYVENKVEYHHNNFSVYLKDKGDLEGFINDMRLRIDDKGKVLKRTEQFSSIMDMIVTPQQKAIPPVAALIILIAAINIFSIVFLKNIKTQQINSIYKCIGYTSWHLICSNLIYVTAIALAAVIITFPISFLTYSPIMRLSLSMFHFSEYPMRFNLVHLILANFVVIVIFIISTLASSRSLFRVNARALVQE